MNENRTEMITAVTDYATKLNNEIKTRQVKITQIDKYTVERIETYKTSIAYKSGQVLKCQNLIEKISLATDSWCFANRVGSQQYGITGAMLSLLKRNTII